jgi:hypothetical protein
MHAQELEGGWREGREGGREGGRGGSEGTRVSLALNTPRCEIVERMALISASFAPTHAHSITSTFNCMDCCTMCAS